MGANGCAAETPRVSDTARERTVPSTGELGKAAAAPSAPRELLSIRHLSVTFTQYEGRGARQVELPVIRDLNATVREGELVAVVGSSGSGKSLLAHAVMGILPENCDARGNITFCGELLDAGKIRQHRGRDIVLVPQSVNYLDPLEKVGPQVRRERKGREYVRRQRELFRSFELDHGVEDLYPFELSGGMARRVLLTTAMMESPRVIVADEPTPGLHLTAARHAMQEFRDFADAGNGVLLITHDVELALEVADRIAVFYAGTTVEEADVSDFDNPGLLRHPYSKALCRALPRFGFHAIEGVQPYVKDLPEGCPFGPRCDLCSDECRGEIPVREVRGGLVRCVRAE